VTRFPRLALPILGLALLAGTALAADAPRNVVLIGWDGTQRNHLHEMIGRNEVPNLMALAADGALVDVDVTSGATDTKAGWSQILTGYTPDKSGVYSNAKFQPIPLGFTVWERLEEALGKDSIFTAAIVGKKAHVDADAPRTVAYDTWLRNQQKRLKPGATAVPKPQGGEITERDGQKVVVFHGKPYYNASTHMDLWVNGLGENEKVGQRALAEIAAHKDQRFFLFVHFQYPDHAGHKHGENSQEYTDGIRSDDEWTGKIIAQLKDLGLYDKTLVYVTADHGFNEGAKGHPYAPYVFLGTNDKLVTRNGDRSDIAPTILKRFGVDLKALQPALDGIALDEPAPERKAPAVKPKAPRQKGQDAANRAPRARRQQQAMPPAGAAVPGAPN
jgi:hypothetical protein